MLSPVWTPIGFEVFDGADDDEIAEVIAQQLQLVFFPAHNALLHQYLVYRRRVQSVRQGLIELLRRIYEAPARAAQRVGRPDYEWKPNFLSNFFAFQKRAGNAPLTDSRAQFEHQQPEFLAVFGRFNGFDVDPDNFYVIFLPNPGLFAVDSEVEGRLAAHSGQYGVDGSAHGAVLFQNLDNRLLFERQQVYMIGVDGVGHDRSRIGVDQRDLNTFITNGAGGL